MSSGQPLVKEESRTEALFFDKINHGEKISDPIQLPSACHELIKKTILMNFFAEWWGGVNYFRCLNLAPYFHEREHMQIIAREEMGHAHILAKGSLSVLGIDPFQYLAKTVKEQKNILHVFQYPEKLCRSWGDVLIFNRLQDSSADMQLDEFADAFFEPYCQDIKQIEAEEVGHVAHADQAIRDYMRQGPVKYELQQALNFWLPLVLDVFGKSKGKSEQLYLKYRLKQRTNEESRILFISRITPFFQEMGLNHSLLNA